MRDQTQNQPLSMLELFSVVYGQSPRQQRERVVVRKRRVWRMPRHRAKWGYLQPEEIWLPCLYVILTALLLGDLCGWAFR
jgi:hypothetical protein